MTKLRTLIGVDPEEPMRQPLNRGYSTTETIQESTQMTEIICVMQRENEAETHVRRLNVCQLNISITAHQHVIVNSITKFLLTNKRSQA